MKKSSSLLLATALATAALAALPQLAFALEVKVDDRGIVSFYEDGVLGDSSEKSEKEEPPKERATKVVPAGKDKRIEIKAKNELIEIKVKEEDKKKEAEKEDAKKKPELETEVEKVETNPLKPESIETKRLRAQFNLTRMGEMNDELKTDDSKRALTEKEKEYRIKLEQERRKSEDSLEVKSNLDSSGIQELELQNNAVRANLRGADFAFNPETNSVILTTPSGQEHELNHLPDQALQRINAVVTVQNTDPAAADVTIETNDKGTVYRTKGVRRKKLFGLFNRDIQTEVVLNDETGEVATMEQPSPGLLGKLLDAFSR